jgi:hypothetical protein
MTLIRDRLAAAGDGPVSVFCDPPTSARFITCACCTPRLRRWRTNHEWKAGHAYRVAIVLNENMAGVVDLGRRCPA